MARKAKKAKGSKGRKAKGAQPRFRANMREGAKTFGCYVKRVKVRGGGTTVRGFCRKTSE